MLDHVNVYVYVYIYVCVHYATGTYLHTIVQLTYLYIILLYFAWADQRIQQFYNYHNVLRR